MKRLMMLVLALVLAILPAAQAELETEVLLPDEGESALEESELRHALVKSLFMAAAGTDFESESKLIEELEQQEELQPSPAPGEEGEEFPTLREQRRAYLAGYRAQTLPWLLLAFDPETECAENPEETESADAPDGAQTSENPDLSDGAEKAASEAPEWTPETAWMCFSETDTGRSYLTLLETLGGTDAQSGLAVTREICQRWLAEIDHEKLAQINGDYACWLYCADTQIDYPVVQGADNSYYLDRLFNGSYNSGGTLFIDYRNLPGFQDPNTLIYGHHMRNDSMFGILTEYGRPGFYESHPFLLMASAEEIAVIELFAGYTTSKNDHCYDIAISGEEDMLAFVEEACAKSDFETDVQPTAGDRLVTLSTCAYAFENARYIAIGRLASVWQSSAGEW